MTDPIPRQRHGAVDRSRVRRVVDPFERGNPSRSEPVFCQPASTRVAEPTPATLSGRVAVADPVEEHLAYRAVLRDTARNAV